ncbi:MAG: extracellular solute-binding protein [Spirochaetales bacterium]|nr:extracellular solute-binding protein [Spirochaetales bacterium]
MKKTLLVTSLIVLLATTAVFANGSKEAQSTAVVDNSPVKLEYLIEQQSVAVDQNSPIVKKINEKYNVIIDAWEVDPKKYNEQLNVKFAAGEMPDVFLLDPPGVLPSYVEGGIVAELPIEVIREKAPDYAKAIDEINPEIWNAVKYKGKNYGYAQPMSAYPMAVYWRKDWLDKLGLEVPTTIEEWETVLTAFVNEDPDGNGKKDTAGMAERVFSAIFGAYGVRCVTGAIPGFKVEEMQLDEQGLPFFPYIDSRAKEALTLLNRWYKLGILDKEFVTGENHGGYTWYSHSFMNGRIGVTCAQPSHYFVQSDDVTDPNNLGRCMKEFKALNPEGEVVIGPAPIGPRGDSGTEAWANIGKLIVISTKAMQDPRKVDAILHMLNDFYTDMDFAGMLTFGIKGEDWKLTDKGPIRLLDGKEARRKGIIQFGYGNTVPFSAYYREKQDTFYRNIAPKGYYRIIMPAAQEYSDNIATLDTLTEQAYFDMITGTKPLSYFDTFVKEFKAAGGDAAEKAIRAAYN